MFVYSKNGKPLALHMKLDGGDNSLYETVPDGGALFFPYKFENGKNWGLVKVSPKNKRDMKVVSDLVKKALGSPDSLFYVYSKSNALTGILAIDRKYCWGPIENNTDDPIIK